MARTVAIGIQNFEELIEKNYFYIDKTHFIKDWWESGDAVTLITRPRRFGKTLNMSMLERFFSVNYAGKGEIFEQLAIWQEEKYRELQGTYPVISLSFARVKEKDYLTTREKICEILTSLYIKCDFLRNSDVLTDKDRDYFDRVSTGMSDSDATSALYQLSDFLGRYYGKRVIILLDEYDTPMQEAYVNGYWDELTGFTRSLFNSAFKTNPYLERAIMTGITRVSKESVFSDLNNLKVVTTTSSEYADAFGFTEDEVFTAMEEYGYPDKAAVKRWYDGFVFGDVRDIYNPWSIINFLDTGTLAAYWANTSENRLVNKLIREGNKEIKEQFETLLQGGVIEISLDEQIVYNQLGKKKDAIWSLLLASGYLKVVEADLTEEKYQLELTNYEVTRMFNNMVLGWFDESDGSYNEFIKALLIGDRKAMNAYMNRVALSTFSFFDAGNRPSGAEPERFYHGFVLGLMVDLRDRYVITSNRESGFGRYDVLLEPLRANDDAIIMEFKVHDPDEEKSLRDTVESALEQIEDRNYVQTLLDKGIPAERIRKYGFAFEGKCVFIG